jgi:7,8-dihydroneopterin aldolase/epimerase/oxygenase
MTDRIVLTNMRFQGVHGYLEWERREPQPFEVDIELLRDLRPAGLSDQLGQTIDYGLAYDLVREVVETRTFTLIERIAETIAEGLLYSFVVDEVVVRVRKPGVQLGGPLDHASVEIRRRRSPSAG